MNFSVKGLFIALLLTLSASVAASAARITGTVTDSQGEPMIEATLRLLSARDSAFVSGVTSDVNGRFNIQNVKSGNYILQVTYLGYETLNTNVKVGTSNVSLKPLVLKESSVMLKEAVVTGVKSDVTVKEDTIEFNAGSYKTPPNAVIEDLLKRLPGVDVDSDGKITVGGKQVTKFLVNGKDFFSDDPKVASKQLPVDIVEKLQVIDRKSDLARLTGVDDGEEETVINLSVKPGMDNGYVGQANVGMGTDDRYAGNFNVNRFWNGNQVSLLGNFNNINQLGFTDGGEGRFNRYGGGNGITTSQALGVNFNVGRQDETFRMGGDVQYGHTDQNTRNSRERQYLFADSTSYQSSRSGSRDRGHNVRANLRIQWKIDSLNTLEFRPTFSLNFNKSYSNDSSLTLAGDAARTEVTRSNNRGSSDGHSYDIGGELWYNHKSSRRRGRSFSFSFEYKTSDTREDDYSTSLNRFYLLDSISLQDKVTDSHSWNNSIGGRLTWTEPIGDVSNGRFLSLSYRLNYRWNNSDKLVYQHPVDYPEMGDPIVDYGSLDFDDELSNRFRNDYFNQRIQLGFKQVRSAYTFDGGITLTPSMTKSIDLINEDRNLPARWVWNVAPYLRYRYRLKKRRNINFDYRGRSSQPSLKQLQPVPDMTNPLRVIIGNPNLDPTFTHNLRLNFNDYNEESQRSITLRFEGSVTQNSIVSLTTYNAETGGQVTTYKNVNGNYDGRLFSMLSLPMRNRHWQMNFNLMGSYNQNIGFNNGQRNRSNNLSVAPSMSVAFRPENWEAELRPYYRLQNTRNTLNTRNNQNVKNFGGRFNGSWYSPFGLVVTTDLNFTASRGMATGYNTDEWMWNASISYQFLRNRTGTIMLRAYDLLQQRKSIRRSVTANYIDDTSYNALTRYFMVSFTYKINTFGKNRPKDRNEGMGPGGFGGPGGRGGYGGGRGGFGGGRPR